MGRRGVSMLQSNKSKQKGIFKPMAFIPGRELGSQKGEKESFIHYGGTHRLKACPEVMETQ
jgi:hypothetical protein